MRRVKGHVAGLPLGFNNFGFFSSPPEEVLPLWISGTPASRSWEKKMLNVIRRQPELDPMGVNTLLQSALNVTARGNKALG